MDYSQFQAKVPCDPANIFWTHIDLLQRNRKVFVNLKKTENDYTNPQKSPNPYRDVYEESDKAESPKKTPSKPPSKFKMKDYNCYTIFVNKPFLINRRRPYNFFID